MISKSHPNRTLYNWLAYNNNDFFLRKFSPRISGVLYDLGCGEAYYKQYFLKYATNYIGVDWQKNYHNINIDIVADLNQPISIKSEAADTVISLSVMEHLNEPQIMLNEAFRILKPNGNIILQVPWQWHTHEEPYDFFRYSPYALQHMFENAGFSDITIESQSGFFTTLTLKANYFSNRLLRKPKLLRYIVSGLFFLPLWTLGQLLAPLLDRIDSNWEKETIGYFVTARKKDK